MNQNLEARMSKPFSTPVYLLLDIKPAKETILRCIKGSIKVTFMDGIKIYSARKNIFYYFFKDYTVYRDNKD